jgi:SAM-dependent methyltransferase
MAIESTKGPLACLLCNSANLKSVDRLTGQELRKLWSEGMNIHFSAEAFGQIEASTTVPLNECADCGFRFFDPKFGGNEAFYRELEHPNYYSPGRPEFARTVGFAVQRRLKRILDVGCGSGAFLDLAKAAGLVTEGLELNTAAAEKARAKQHRIYGCLLHELQPEQMDQPYDLITLFQVLEHVPDPVRVLQDARARLSAGGFIAVSVPSENGVCRLAPLDPHQWPPHHTSRWRYADFAQVAKRCGLRISEQGGDMLFGKGIEERWALNNRMASILGRPSTLGGDILPKTVSFLYRVLRLKHLFRGKGASIYAYFQEV